MFDWNPLSSYRGDVVWSIFYIYLWQPFCAAERNGVSNFEGTILSSFVEIRPVVTEMFDFSFSIF